MDSSSTLPPDWPGHVAIIMDGNGRWAKRRGRPRLEGHRQGAKAVRRAVEFCRSRGIHTLTLYAFSTENWKRPDKEVSGLMLLLSRYLDSEIQEINANEIRFRTIGNVEKLPQALVNRIQAAKDLTAPNQAMTLNIALSYGGRQDIIAAAIRLGRSMQSGDLDESSVDEQVFSSFLDTAGLTDPDLLIRTGGEIRVSNFLLWQAAYAELYFTPTLWPDFDEETFLEAVEAYRSRQRRFGMTSEQMQDKDE